MGENSDVNNVGFDEEGLSWLPSHILHEACGDHHLNQEQLGRRGRHYHYRHRYDVNRADSLQLPSNDEQLRSAKKYQNRSRYGVNKASGGPGMRAVFLEVGRKTCGTGVFLPRRTDTDHRPTNKPACSPVLLPYRVVQALNLNVQALGLQISSHEDQNIKQNRRVDQSPYDKVSKHHLRENCGIISEDQTCSPAAFLPKEWSY